jgi:hypothetical protein
MPHPAALNGSRIFIRALILWVALIAAEFVHGLLRTIFLLPVVGDFRSRQIGVFTGSILILAVAYLLVPSLRTTERKALIGVGALWLALTVAFELLFGHFVFRRSWENLASTTTFSMVGCFRSGWWCWCLRRLWQ